jgi:hypothetical protein
VNALFPRLAVERLRHLAGQFPAVLILGARQVGKTTLARAAFPGHAYVDLETPRLRELFAEDAAFQIGQRAGAGVILDEAQAVPAVFAALRGIIDADRQRRGLSCCSLGAAAGARRGRIAGRRVGILSWSR